MKSNKLLPLFLIPLAGFAFGGLRARHEASSAQVVKHDVCEITSAAQSAGPGRPICDRLIVRWRELTGIAPNPGAIRIVLSGVPDNVTSPSSWHLEWIVPTETVSPAMSALPIPGLSAYFEKFILPHEAGHSIWMSWHGTGADPYGSSAPDWLDEAAAIWMEPPNERSRRTAQLPTTAPSLRTILTMPHPNLASQGEDARLGEFQLYERAQIPPCGQKCPMLPEPMQSKYTIIEKGRNRYGRDTTVTWYSDTPLGEPTLEHQEFYPLSYSVLHFIRSTGGTRAVQELSRRLRADPRPRVEAVVALPGLPTTFAAFETAWLAFIRNPPAERD